MGSQLVFGHTVCTDKGRKEHLVHGDLGTRCAAVALLPDTRRLMWMFVLGNLPLCLVNSLHLRVYGYYPKQ